MHIAPRTLKRIVAGTAGLYLLYLLLGWLALPALLQHQAERYITERTGHHLTLDRPRFNPLNFSLTLRNLKLAEPDGKPLLSFAELTVDLSAASLLRRALVFDRIELRQPRASVALAADGRLNWSALLDALQGKDANKDKPSAPPRLLIHSLTIGDGEIAFNDARAGYATRIEPLQLQLHEISTLPEDAGTYQLSAQSESGARLRWQGRAGLNPLAVNGSIALENVALARLAPYLGKLLPGAPPSGIAAIGGDYRVAYGGGRLDLQLSKLSARLDQLRLALTAKPGPVLAVDSIAANGGSFDLARNAFALDSIGVKGAQLEYAQAGGRSTPPLRVEALQVDDLKLDLSAHRAGVKRIALQGGLLNAVRNPQGRLDLLDLAAAFTPPPTQMKAKQNATPAKPWSYRVDRIELAGMAAALRDESLSPAANLRIEDIAVGVDGFSDRLADPLALTAALRFPAGGSFKAQGTVTPGAPAADLQLTLSGLSLKPAQPWLSSTAKLVLEKGQASAAGRMTYNGSGTKGAAYHGELAISDLRLNEADSGKLFLAWKQLGSKDVDAAQDHVSMGKLTLDGLDTRLIIDKDKSVNIVRMFQRPAATPSLAPALQAPAPVSNPPPFLVSIDRLRLRNCELDFADYSLALPFGTRIHNLRGSLNGLSSRPAAPGQVELDGEVDEFGLARVVGQIDLFKPAEFMDLKVVFRNVDMARLTPYSATFAGRRIDGGRLSLNLEYRIKQRQLVGDNQVSIDRIRLGEKVESPTAKDLPLDLAIAVLEDSDGRIDLGLPVSGSLDDPQFSYGAIVWKAILNVFGKIATAPFRLLGNLFGGAGGFEEIVFEPGMSRLSPPEREKLTRLAEMLNKRPGLAVTVRGPWSPADRFALQDRQVRRAVAEHAGDKLAEREDPGPLSTATPKVQSAIESLFAERIGAAELLAMKEGYRKANPGQLQENVAGKMLSRLSSLIRQPRTLDDNEVTRMKGADFHLLLFERLRQKEVVTDEQLQALARARAQDAMTGLAAAGAPAGRYSVGDPATIDAREGDVPLKLEPGAAPKSP